MTNNGNSHPQDRDASRHSRRMYLRFAAMILTAMVVMYGVMFVGSWEWSHVRFSESRVFMALTMGGAMGLVMMGWMLNMYKNAKINLAIVAARASRDRRGGRDASHSHLRCVCAA